MSARATSGKQFCRATRTRMSTLHGPQCCALARDRRSTRPDEFVIARVGDRPGPSGFGGAREVVHLTRRHVMEVEARIVTSTSREVVVEANHCIAQQH